MTLAGAGLLVAVAIAAVPEDIAAGHRRVGVIVLERTATGGRDNSTRRQLIEDVHATIRGFVGVVVPDTDEMLSASLNAERCRGELACLTGVISAARLNVALEVVIDLSLQPAVVTTRCIDDHGRSLAPVALDELVDLTLEQAVVRHVQRLLRAAGFELGGRLRVQVTPPDASIRVANHPLVLGGQVFDGVTTLPKGTYELVVQREGFAPQRQMVTVEPGKETRIAVDLDEAGSIWASPWLWVSVGVAVVGAGVGLSFALTSGGTDRYTICQASTSMSCPP